MTCPLQSPGRFRTQGRRGTAVVAIASLVLAFTVVSSAADRWPRSTTTLSRQSTPYLPFDFPYAPGSRLVLAHYMPTFPMSFDNAPPGADYYAVQYMTPDGEGGIHSPYGGFIRDRPLPRPPRATADWRQADLATEIAQARSVGIDGFAVDVLEPPRSANDVVPLLLTTAHKAAGFTIMVTADMSGPLEVLSPADFAKTMAPLLESPAALRLGDGRPVLGAFAAERRPPRWWADVMARLRGLLVSDIAFVPTFLDVGDNPEAFAPVSYGMSMWGGRSPSTMAVDDIGRGYPVDVVRRAHQLGKVWMQPIPFQDMRPRGGIFSEADNGQTSRAAWQIAIDNHAEWAQLITWNDYAESTAFAPSMAHGFRLLDMTAYDIARFKTGRSPRILRDAVYVSHRGQPAAAAPTFPQSVLLGLDRNSNPTRDAIETVTFAMAPAHVQITSGGQNYSCDVPEGRGVCVSPLGTGPVSVSMTRAGREVAAAQSDVDITDRPFVQDLQYRVVGGLR